MRLEALKFVVGRQVRIAVIQMHDKSDRDLPVLQMIDERAAARLRVERPALRMHDQSGPMAFRGDLPQLLDADAVLLRIDAVAQVEPRHQFLRQRAAASFREQRVAGMKLHPRLVARLVRPVLRDAHIAGRHAAHRTGIGVQHLGRGESGIDLDAQRLGLLREPLADVAKAHDVIAVIVHQRRQQPAGNRVRLRGGQDFEAILADRRVQRRAERFPVGQELVQRDRIDDRAGKDVRADRPSLFPARRR